VRHASKHQLQLVVDALEASEQFFSAITSALLTERTIVRVRTADTVENYLAGPLGALARAIDGIATKLQEGKEFEELNEQRAKIESCAQSLTRWLKVDDESQVYWAERGGKRGTIVTLRTAPIDVAPELREALFARKVSVVCTSATLAINGEISTFQTRMGAEAARTAIEYSPFDYERNMRVYVASDIPLPSPKEARLAIEALTDWIRFCSLRCGGGSLVLFTSYTDMRKVAEELEPVYAKAGRPFLMQGSALSRTDLAKAMRREGNAILFGTDSFWTGIDVPGDALAQVILTRLPFDIPSHPIQEARADHIRAQGGNPFSELTLPDAVVKFRQGIGRLIRTAKDRGLITLLDARVLHKTYGKLFLGALPKKDYERLSLGTREECFKPFL